MSSIATDDDPRFEAFRRLNRPYMPGKAFGDYVYQVYRLLRNAPPEVSTWAKQGTFESAMEDKHSWRVIGISEAALRHVVNEPDIKRKMKPIRRGHWYDRRNRFSTLFGPGTKELDRDALLRYCYEHDSCVLVLDTQNNRTGTAHWGRLIPVPEDIFTSRGYGVRLRLRKDLPWALDALRELELAT